MASSSADDLMSSRIAIYATVPTGFEHGARDECRDAFPNDDNTAATISKGSVRFHCPLGELEKALALRSVDNIYVRLYSARLELHKDSLDEQLQALAFDAAIDWRSGLTALKIANSFYRRADDSDELGFFRRVSMDSLERLEKPNEIEPKFRATCYRSGKHDFGSPEAMATFGGYIQDLTGWTVNLKQFDVEVVLIVDGALVDVCLTLTSGSLHQRNIVSFGPTTLRSTISYGLIRMAQPRDGEVLCDPLCGSGSGLGFPNLIVLAGDRVEDMVTKTRHNAQSVLNREAASIRALDPVRWNSRNLPLRNALVDIWVSDLPFNIRCKSDNEKLYRHTLRDLARTSKLGSTRAVFLTCDKRNMKLAVQLNASLWRQTRSLTVNIGGVAAVVYCLRRTMLKWRPWPPKAPDSEPPNTGIGAPNSERPIET